MKTIETYTINYVIPESPEEKAELEEIIRSVSQEKFGRDFKDTDLTLVPPGSLPKEGYWVEKKK